MDRERLGNLWRIHCLQCIVIIAVIILYFVLFHIDIPGLIPLENKPDEIVVYKYGVSTTFKPADKAYQELYKRLRSCAHSKIIDLVGHPTMFSMSAPEADYIDSYLKYGVVVRVIYYKAQQYKQDGITHSYTELDYVLDYPVYEPDSSKYVPEIPETVLYFDPQTKHYLGITNTGDFKKAVKDYVENLQVK